MLGKKQHETLITRIERISRIIYFFCRKSLISVIRKIRVISDKKPIPFRTISVQDPSYKKIIRVIRDKKLKSYVYNISLGQYQVEE